jgi:hypothetical protein
VSLARAVSSRALRFCARAVASFQFARQPLQFGRSLPKIVGHAAQAGHRAGELGGLGQTLSPARPIHRHVPSIAARSLDRPKYPLRARVWSAFIAPV